LVWPLQSVKLYDQALVTSSALYYGRKPTLEDILEEIKAWINRL